MSFLWSKRGKYILSNPRLLAGTEEFDEDGGAGWIVTAFLMVNVALGVGTLNFPAAVDEAGGIYYSFALQLVGVFLSLSTLLMLTYCSDMNKDRTYHAVMRSMCGKRGQQLAAFVLAINLFTCCVGSLVIMGDLMDSLFSSLIGGTFCEQWYFRRTVTLPLVSAVFILPATCCKKVDLLGSISTIATLAMLYPAFLTVYGYFYIIPKDVVIRTEPISMATMLAMFPVFGIGYEVQDAVVEIYSCMRDRCLTQFLKSCVSASAFLLVIYLTIGSFGYLTFGEGVANNVMKMYDPKDPFVMVGVSALILKMLATFAILALCGRNTLVDMYADFRGLKGSDLERSEPCRRYAMAFLWVFASTLWSVLTEDMGLVVKYISSAAALIIYFFPGICLMRRMTMLIENEKLKRWWNPYVAIYGILMAMVGVIAFVLVLRDAILTQSGPPKPTYCEELMKQFANETTLL